MVVNAKVTARNVGTNAGTMAIVWLRMAWGVRERGRDQLTVWETFKIYDGKIHAVEAFMRILPVEKRNGGWEERLLRRLPSVGNGKTAEAKILLENAHRTADQPGSLPFLARCRTWRS
jgi:hypothetical protein